MALRAHSPFIAPSFSLSSSCIRLVSALSLLVPSFAFSFFPSSCSLPFPLILLSFSPFPRSFSFPLAVICSELSLANEQTVRSTRGKTQREYSPVALRDSFTLSLPSQWALLLPRTRQSHESFHDFAGRFALPVFKRISLHNRTADRPRINDRLIVAARRVPCSAYSCTHKHGRSYRPCTFFPLPNHFRVFLCAGEHFSGSANRLQTKRALFPRHTISDRREDAHRLTQLRRFPRPFQLPFIRFFDEDTPNLANPTISPLTFDGRTPTCRDFIDPIQER